MKDVLKFLDTLNIKNDSKLIVAVSYGPDSMALLNILKNKFGYSSIVCAHVHHNHRKESDIEALNLKSFCDRNNIIFEMMKIENYTDGKFTEEDARYKRYAFFESLLKKYGSKYLFTAHHGDDLTETVLMRLVRGSSIKGYGGIPLISEREDYQIIRPLLFITKSEIIDYCNKNKIDYATDISNNSDYYTRNRYRKYILPKLKEENKNVHRKILKFSLMLNENEDYFNRIVNKVYSKVLKSNSINLEELKKEDPLIVKRVIMRYMFDYYKDDIKKINDAHVNEILKAINDSKPNIEIKLPNKINLIKSYDSIYFDKEKAYNSYCFLFNGYLSLPNNYCITKIEDTSDKSNFTIRLNSKEVKLPLYVRNKRDGDIIEILNLGGKKKIKDIFIDEKIPKQIRKNYPLLIDSNGNILWIPGIKKSKYDRSKNGNYDIILKYQKEEK